MVYKSDFFLQNIKSTWFQLKPNGNENKNHNKIKTQTKNNIFLKKWNRSFEGLKNRNQIDHENL